MLHKQQPLCFECTACGACCHGDEESYIETNKSEIEKIRQHLSLSKKHFNKKHVVQYTDGSLGIRISNAGRCSLLGDNNRCSVYPVRPAQCRSYPFWAEVLKNKYTWRSEARRCEGINRGKPIDRKLIEEKLTISLNGVPNS